MAATELLTSDANYGLSLERAEDVLWHNGYPGRWLAMGRGAGEHEETLYLAYSFGGRSDDSKNRTAIQEEGAVRLVAPGMSNEEMAQVPGSALIYYHSSDTRDGVFVVSNGAQTTYVLDAMVEGAPLKEAVTNAPTVPGMVDGKEVNIDLSSFEPDKINTPRITGVIDVREGAATPFGLAVVRKSPKTGKPIRSFYVAASLEDIKPGQGWAIQTYGVNDPDDKETPVPSFDQKPYGFPFEGDAAHIASMIRMAIGEKTFAAAVVRVIDVRRRQFNGNAIINTRG